MSGTLQLDSKSDHDSRPAAFLGRACELAYLPADTSLVEKLKSLAQGTKDEITEAVQNSLWSEIRQGMPSHMMGNYLSRLLK